MQIRIHNNGTQTWEDVTAPEGLGVEDAIIFVAGKMIVEQELGAVSMNWYCRPRLRLYTNLVATVGTRKKRFEYVGSQYVNSYEIYPVTKRMEV